MKGMMIAMVLGAAGLGFGVASAHPAAPSEAASQIGLNTPQPDKFRFRLIGDEPIATADGKNQVPGVKVIVLRDTKSDQCYVGFIAGSSLSMTGPSACP